MRKGIEIMLFIILLLILIGIVGMFFIMLMSFGVGSA